MAGLKNRRTLKSVVVKTYTAKCFFNPNVTAIYYRSVFLDAVVEIQ